MPDQPTAGQDRVLERAELERDILGMLLHRYPALVALEELVRHFGYLSPEKQITEIFVREGVEDLQCSGLAHQLGEFAFASYAAVRAEQLGG
jgi:hypothetical protein